MIFAESVSKWICLDLDLVALDLDQAHLGALVDAQRGAGLLLARTSVSLAWVM